MYPRIAPQNLYILASIFRGPRTAPPPPPVPCCSPHPHLHIPTHPHFPKFSKTSSQSSPAPPPEPACSRMRTPFRIVPPAFLPRSGSPPPSHPYISFSKVLTKSTAAPHPLPPFRIAYPVPDRAPPPPHPYIFHSSHKKRCHSRTGATPRNTFGARAN